MLGDEVSSRDAEARRTFLELLLAHCRRANWPGSQQLIEMIERELAGKSLARPDDPPDDRPESGASQG